jgi:uncharacterized phage protein gp47/JayE
MANETTDTAFVLPQEPEQYGTVLVNSNLRKIDFSGLDFDTSRQAILEYIATYFPNDFNDFVASNGIIMLTEIVASATAKLALRSDLLAQEATLPTALTEEAVVNHLALINQRIKRQSPATVLIQATIDRPVNSDIEINPGTKFQVSGPDGKPVIYEIYKAPGDYVSKMSIPAGKRGVILYAIEGEFAQATTVMSSGAANQQVIITATNALEFPIFIYATLGGVVTEWYAITEPIERYGPNDKVVEVNFIEDKIVLRFGDNVTGSIPPSGSSIEIRYRVGGGRRGRLAAGQLETSLTYTPLPPASAPISVLFRNINASEGGYDKETLEEAKRRAPKDYALQRSIVTPEDYAQAVTNFSHPTFGIIKKSIVTLRSSINANLVEIYVLSEGQDGLPVAANEGLKRALATYIDQLNVATDSIQVLDGKIKPVDVELNVVINKNADASIVRQKVENAITSYFSLNNWNMGEAFYTSQFIDQLQSIDGISFVDLFSPNDNILPTGQLGDGDPLKIGFNEVITLGSRKTSYYYERTPPPAGYGR